MKTPKKQTTENYIKEIYRKTRRIFSSEQNIQIVMEALKANKHLTVKNNLINSANNISNSVLESIKMEANTHIELTKNHSNHLTLNNHINKECKKQKRALNKASDFINHGLEKDNLDINA